MLKGANWKVESLALQAGASVVGLQSFTGDLFTDCQFHLLLILVLTCLFQNT
jgi:hypothetical protein